MKISRIFFAFHLLLHLFSPAAECILQIKSVYFLESPNVFRPNSTKEWRAWRREKGVVSHTERLVRHASSGPTKQHMERTLYGVPYTKNAPTWAASLDRECPSRGVSVHAMCVYVCNFRTPPYTEEIRSLDHWRATCALIFDAYLPHNPFNSSIECTKVD